MYPNAWRVVNLVHILLMLAHWFGCFYYLLSEWEGFTSDWSYPYPEGDFATLTRKYLGSLYWSTLTLTTIGDLPTPETNAEWVAIWFNFFDFLFLFFFMLPSHIFLKSAFFLNLINNCEFPPWRKNFFFEILEKRTKNQLTLIYPPFFFFLVWWNCWDQKRKNSHQNFKEKEGRTNGGLSKSIVVE